MNKIQIGPVSFVLLSMLIWKNAPGLCCVKGEHSIFLIVLLFQVMNVLNILKSKELTR